MKTLPQILHFGTMAETVTAAAAAAFNQEQFDELKEELIEVLHHEDGWDFTWLFCFLVFVGVFVAITFVRRYFLGWVDKQTKKTDNVIDDFVVDMIERWFVVLLPCDYVY